MTAWHNLRVLIHFFCFKTCIKHFFYYIFFKKKKLCTQMPRFYCIIFPFLVSPKAKQPYWQDMYTADRGKTLPRKRFKIDEKDDFLISAAFCDNFPYTFRIATGSNKGNVIIWDAFSERQLYTTGRRGFSAPCLLYMNDEGWLLVI